MKKMWSVLTGTRDSYARILAPLMIMLCIGVAATSCKDSLTDAEPENPTTGGKTVPAGTKLYAYISLVQADGTPTRAEGDGTDGGADKAQPDSDDKYGGTNNGDYDADFEPGNPDDESKIDNLLFIFYDKDGNHVGQYESESFTKKEYEDKRDPSKEDDMVKDDNDVIIEKIGWGTLIQVEIETTKDIDEFNTKVSGGSYLVVLNYNKELADNLKNAKTQTAAEKILTKTLESNANGYQLGIADDKKGFLMTTAGHFDKADGKYLWYDKVPTENKGLYESQALANANPLIAYVERVASRIDFEINTENIKSIEVLYGETDVYELWFNPDGWAVEAQEKTSYLNKNLEVGNKSEYSATYPSDFANWIDYKNNRIFWAKSISFESPTTNPYKYPVLGTETDGLESDDQMQLRYVTFKGIRETKTGPVQQLDVEEGYDFFEKGHKKLTGMDYVLEHTFKNTELNVATNPYAVPTSAVLRGRYTATFKKTDQRPNNNPEGKEVGAKLPNLERGFYIRYVDMERTDKAPEWKDNPGGEKYQYHLYLEYNNSDNNVKDTEMLTAMLKEQYMVWKKNGDTYSPVKSGDEEAAVFAILNAYKRHDNVSGMFIPSSNAYTLQIDAKKLADFELYLITSENEMNNPVRITSGNIETANEALLEQLGYAQYYWQAYAFFYAPIPHYAGNEDPFIEEGKSTYTGLFNYRQTNGSYDRDEQTGNYIVDHKTGDFGVVRNHIYNIKINGISNLGYGIPGDDIIPLPEPTPDHKLYQFDLELKVLPWNQFNYQFDI